MTDPRLLLPPLITVLIHATLGAKQGARVPKGFIVLSGTGIKDTREWVPSATEALRLVKIHMKLRRPGVRIEDERGNPLSFFQLKENAAREAHKKMPSG